ncbi:hypothetical protein QFZ72_001241 [Bacillus sp. V2I10]|nr:hypothetical protein [Bacillus sp. V2I10]
MTKYSLDTKLAAVHAYLDGVESFKQTAQKHFRLLQFLPFQLIIIPA